MRKEAPNQHDVDGKPLKPGDRVLVFSERRGDFLIPGEVWGPGSGMDYGAVMVTAEGDRLRDYAPGWLKKVEPPATIREMALEEAAQIADAYAKDAWGHTEEEAAAKAIAAIIRAAK